MTRQDLILIASANNAEAAAFLDMAVDVLHTWDDLIDRDKPVAAEDIHRAMWAALVAIPRNRFYRAHFDDLNPILAVAIQNWHAANVMEEAEIDLEVAFILRSAYVDLITMCALLCGGAEHARRVTPQIRAYAHGEGYEQYLKNLSAERAAREGA